MKVQRTALICIAFAALFLSGQVYADDADAAEEDELDLSGEDMSVTEEETVELDESWLPIDNLGADLACSACELVVDRLTAQMRTAEYAAKAAAEKEASEKKKDEEEAAKEEDKPDEQDAEAKEEKDTDKKKKDKKKKDKKKKNSEVKINKKVVAETVLQYACNRTNFLGLNVIGSYPGRQYQIGGKSLSTPDSKNIVLACQYFLKEEGTTTYLAKTLAGNGKSKIKKMKRNVCERRAKVCKSAALGFEAESACLMKSMRAFDRGDYEKAKKHAGDCSETEV